MRNKYQIELPENVIKLCEDIFKQFQITLDWDLIQSKSRESEIVFMRAVVCVIFKYCGYSLTTIGGAVNRDHASALYLINIYPNNIKNSIWQKKYSGVLHFLNNRISINGTTDFSGLEKDAIIRQIRFHQFEIKRLKGFLSEVEINCIDVINTTDKGKWAKLLE